MKKLRLLLLAMAVVLGTASCKKDKNLANVEVHEHDKNLVSIDTVKFDGFFAKHPKFKEYEPEIRKLYRKHNHYIWHDKKGLIEFAEAIYNHAYQIEDEGLEGDLPYKEKLSYIFYGDESDKPDLESELLISSMYFFYTKKVYEGLDTEKSRATGWYLPREKVDYVAYLDTLMKDPTLIKQDKKELFSQYYNLKKGLEKYRRIQKKGGWGTIKFDEGIKQLKKGDSSAVVSQVRKRLYTEGYLKDDSDKNIFDDELAEAVNNYEKTHNREPNSTISQQLIDELNVPVEERIKTISVNMERCRWVSPEINDAKEYIAVNIPSYKLRYVRDGEIVLNSKVVVGKVLNKTVVFSGDMSYLVFSPYWNVPKSILENEIKPAIKKNPDYLAQHNMEWNGNMVRQKPGGKNSLGLVKFMFPNSNNIYLHDTPAKSLFNKDDRAFSHGCVRVEKARDLAVAITKKDGNWTESKVDAAMNAGSEKVYRLKNKIPVYIVYFTAWADENGNVAFFDDIYKRDDRLATMLYKS
jgi:murein L,D-transpeptidase YcbB/YkuD